MSTLNSHDFNIIKISKKNGSFRLIYVPNKEIKKKLKRKVSRLSKLVDKYDEGNYVVGFRSNINCVSSAIQHIGYQCSIKMDLSTFFDTVTIEHLSFLDPKELRFVSSCLIEGIPRQGLPTSPAISNLAFIPADKQIAKALSRLVKDYKYTRYADDLIMSFNISENSNNQIIDVAKMIINAVTTIIKNHNFILNKKKTTIKLASSGNRIITGIAVNDTGVLMSRKTRRKIRAAEHQGNFNSANGLREWGACKLPNTKLIKKILEDSDFIMTTNKKEISANIGISTLFIQELGINELYLYSKTLKSYAILNNDNKDMKLIDIGGVNSRYSKIILGEMFDRDRIISLKKAKRHVPAEE